MRKKKSLRNFVKRVFGRLTLAGQLTLLYGTAFSVVFIIISVILMVTAFYLYGNMYKDELTKTISNVQVSITGGEPITDDLLTSSAESKSIGIRVSDMLNPNITIAATDNFPTLPVHPRRILRDADMNQNAVPVSTDDGKNYMYILGSVNYNGRILLIEVSRSNELEQHILFFFGLAFFAANVVGIIGMFSIGKRISRRLLLPIVQVSRMAEQISVEDLSRRIELTGPDDEIRELSSAFNGMISRLQIAFEKQNRFVSDASHELRTPIAVIQGYVSLIDRWGKTDPAVLQESIDSIKATTGHMSELVRKLLQLAKVDSGTRELQLSQVNLNELAAEVVKEVEILDRPCEISLAEDAQVVILGDSSLVKQLLWIFIDNSMKYCTDAPKIKLRIFTDGDGVPCFSESDNGIGISEDDLPHVFERFFRADKSRSNEKVNGAGLGLAIADWIIRQHKASVSVTSALGKGTEFTVRFGGEK